MTHAYSNDQRAELAALYTQMAPASLLPLWEVLSNLVRSEPSSPARPHLWSYDTIRAYLMRAGELISAAEAERRVLILENPGLPGTSSITSSLYAGVQLVMPGEIAPCHRHTQSALRFVLEGHGAYTALDGEKAMMEPFDLVLTPGGQWHDHGNDTSSPVMWLDGLDIPIVRHFDASFSERYPEDRFPESAPPGDTSLRYGRNLRPLSGTVADRRPSRMPLFHYRYAEWRESLNALSQISAPDPYMGHALEFLNPANGGPVMDTISAHVRLIPAGFQTRQRRSTDGTIFAVVEGTGTVHIGSTSLDLSPRDIFVVPAWADLSFEPQSDLVLFGYSDKAAQMKLNLYREQCA